MSKRFVVFWKNFLGGIFLFAFVLQSFSQTYSAKYADNSVLATGKWYKIATTQQGVYKLSYDDLRQLGVPEPYVSANFRLYGNGGEMVPEKNSATRYDDLVENPVQVYDGGDGYINSGDYIIFYGQSAVKWDYNNLTQIFEHKINLYSDTVYYFLTFDKGNGKRILQYPVVQETPLLTVNKSNEHLFYENNAVNLLKSGKEWYGEVFDDILSRNFDFYLEDIATDENLKVRVNFIARSVVKSAVTVEVNGTSVTDSINTVSGNVNSEFARSITSNIVVPASSENITVTISYYKPQSFSIGWLNYIELEAFKKLIYRGQQFTFRNLFTKGVPVSQFDIMNQALNMRVWKITDFTNISEMPLLGSGQQLSFKVYTDSLHEFIVFDENNLLTPILRGNVLNQNLHAYTPAEYIIITHPDFIDEANRLADFHRINDGLTVTVARTDHIYNEFSSGKQDVAAIRDFIRMLYLRGITDSVNIPLYVLLFGDGSYDMKHRIAENTNFIPTWQTLNSLLPTASYVSDDFFGLMDDSEGQIIAGKLELGIGRFPVTNKSQAATLVDKSIRYGSRQNLVDTHIISGIISNYDTWRNNIVFIADDEDANLHLKQTENLVAVLDSLDRIVNVNKIYLDAFKQVITPFGAKYPEVNESINKVMKQGALVINYMGHGGETGLASENILTYEDIEQYTNFYNLPVFITATCEFCRYDNPAVFSAGERILLHPQGGSIALYSTTRVAYAHSNEVINRFLLKTAFNHQVGQKIRMGDMIKNAKNSCPPGIYMQNFTLLGDPAMIFAIPQYNVVTERIETDTIVSFSDTLKNCRQITVTGYIADKEGNLMDNFDGTLIPTVFDKPRLIYTLANDPGSSSVYPFLLQQTVLYKGNVTITGGRFSFTFFLPKDISYGVGFGKISYYAKNHWADARGVLDSLYFFNSDDEVLSDNYGPDIKLFMEDLNFKDGGLTSTNPLMILFLHDTSGINSYGLGFGKEIQAVLDDEVNTPYVLNDYYVQNYDDYTSGTVNYQFKNLSYGTHKLTIKASDLLGNTSKKDFYFNVALPTDLFIGGVYNYPDPFSDYTQFYVEHNMSNDYMDLVISVYNVLGTKVYEITKQIPPGYYQPINIFWNACTNEGEPLSKGFYTYTVTIIDNDGKKRMATDKMIKIK